MRVEYTDPLTGETTSVVVISAILDEIALESSRLDGANLRVEGLRRRNLATESYIKADTGGTYPMYTEVVTPAAVTAAALAVLSPGGTNVELDWTASPYALAADNKLVVHGTVSFKTTAAAAPNWGINPNTRVYCEIAVDTGAGYVKATGSGWRRGGAPAVALGWDGSCEVRAEVEGAATIRRVAVRIRVDDLGGGSNTCNVDTAEIDAYVLKRVS